MFVLVAGVDVFLLLLGLVMWFLVQSALPMVIAFLGIGAFTLFAVLRATVIEGTGNALIAKGGSTPSVAQHSQVETMVMQGRLREAAEAYRGIIRDEPEDLVACDKLAQLALRELKDYDLAVFAYREAEKRVAEPRRKVGYALLVAGIYRDNIKDEGKTMVELRKLLSRYPEAPNAAQLRAELDELKARHFEGT